jgi:hypothetical protein
VADPEESVEGSAAAATTAGASSDGGEEELAGAAAAGEGEESVVAGSGAAAVEEEEEEEEEEEAAAVAVTGAVEEVGVLATAAEAGEPCSSLLSSLFVTEGGVAEMGFVADLRAPVVAAGFLPEGGWGCLEEEEEEEGG